MQPLAAVFVILCFVAVAVWLNVSLRRDAKNGQWHESDLKTMKRLKPDGTWEYRAMNESESDDAWSSKQY